VEDAAQGVMSTYKGRALGTIGDLGTYSFHETKNLISGEGGCLLVNTPELIARAEIVREKGTDRSQYFRGTVDKYTWRDLGSSFLPGEIVAAFLWAQFEQAEYITQRRLESWRYYYENLADLEKMGHLTRPFIQDQCQHNGHMFYIRLRHGIDRQKCIQTLNQYGVNAVFHYVPLHISNAGKKYTRAHTALSITERVSTQIVRLPLWVGISKAEQDQVIDALSKLLLK